MDIWFEIETVPVHEFVENWWNRIVMLRMSTTTRTSAVVNWNPCASLANPLFLSLKTNSINIVDHHYQVINIPRSLNTLFSSTLWFWLFKTLLINLFTISSDFWADGSLGNESNRWFFSFRRLASSLRSVSSSCSRSTIDRGIVLSI